MWQPLDAVAAGQRRSVSGERASQEHDGFTTSVDLFDLSLLYWCIELFESFTIICVYREADTSKPSVTYLYVPADVNQRMQHGGPVRVQLCKQCQRVMNEAEVCRDLQTEFLPVR